MAALATVNSCIPSVRQRKRPQAGEAVAESVTAQEPDAPAGDVRIDQDQEADPIAFDIEAVDSGNTAWLIEVRHDVRSV